MSKNALLWVLIIIIVAGAVAFALTRKSSEEHVSGTQTEQQTEQPKMEKTAMTDSKQADATSKEEAKPSGDCVRSYDANKFAGKQVDYKNKVVTMTVKGFGDITMELNDQVAPKTVENFVKLAESGFYNCLTFHRIAKDFVIQGGDPEGTGMGGPGYTVPAEIKLLHTKGAVAMARTGDQINPKRESSGSQFYIALQALPMLDGAYTVFGQVTKGLDVVEKIGAVPINGRADGPPVTPVIIEKVTVVSK